MQLHDGCRHILDRRIGIDLERRGKLIGDLSHQDLAVTPVPDVAGCWVQLMDEVGLTVEDHDLPLDTPNIDISPSFRAIRICVHVPQSDA
jgi:hypothetical protein